MSDTGGETPGTKPGPWGARDGVPPPAAETPVRPTPFGGDRNTLLWNLGSTVITAAVLVLITKDWMWVLALSVGVLTHEFGHVLMMNALGCGPASFRIIPFFGGVATPRTPPPTEFKGVLIALAGPVFGLLASLPFFGLAFALNDGRWLFGAFVIAALNLLNLIPAPPLDGSKAIGPVLARIHPWVERGAVLLLGAIGIGWALWQQQWIIAAFLALGVMGVMRGNALRSWAFPLTTSEMAYSVGLYLAAIALCMGTMWGVELLFGEADAPFTLLARVFGTPQ